MNNMSSVDLHKLFNGAGVTLTTTNENSNCTSSAKLVSPWRIVARFVGSDSGDYCAIQVPFNLRVVGASVIARASATGGTMQIKNTTSAVTDAIACETDKAVDYAASIDDAYYTFSKDDDDLRIYSGGTGLASGIVVIDVEPV